MTSHRPVVYTGIGFGPRELLILGRFRIRERKGKKRKRAGHVTSWGGGPFSYGRGHGSAHRHLDDDSAHISVVTVEEKQLDLGKLRGPSYLPWEP